MMRLKKGKYVNNSILLPPIIAQSLIEQRENDL